MSWIRIDGKTPTKHDLNAICRVKTETIDNWSREFDPKEMTRLMKKIGFKNAD